MLTRLSQRSVVRALRSWRASATAARDRKHGVRRALRHMRRSFLSSAFGAWYTMAAESARLSAAALRVVTRCRSGVLLSAYCQWRSHWRTRRLVGHGCVRLSKLRMQQCFGQWERALDLWRAESDAARHAESTSRLRSDLVAQQQRAAAGFLRRWRQRQVAKCLSSWESWTGAAQRRRHAMVQVLQRARQSRLYSAVIAWR